MGVASLNIDIPFCILDSKFHVLTDDLKTKNVKIFLQKVRKKVNKMKKI